MKVRSGTRLHFDEVVAVPVFLDRSRAKNVVGVFRAQQFNCLVGAVRVMDLELVRIDDLFEGRS